MNIIQQITAWFTLAIATVSSWVYLPAYSGTSLFVAILLCGLLIAVHDVKKQNKEQEQ